MGNLEPPIIVAQNLSKVYRLYAKPHYRMMDMFGLLKNKHQAYTEHAALDNINLQVNRGEKVAIIGRNGAGKSTLLKIITNVIRPTSGTIDVDGKVHALLQIGTGFHPEFTGRENVYGYLAQLGLTGKEADEKVREVIEFAELEEYIDQPMKTYSTGMGVRLMFSTSTAITPNLLVLDEVMGVGDSYFSQKSYERMRELCEAKGTTLLLVTHDLYSARNLCDRFIWIDRGKMILEGDGKTITHAYEASIRDQEENRLRQKRLVILKENLRANEDKKNLLYGQINKLNAESPSDLHISHLRFLSNGTELASISMAEETSSTNIRLITDQGEGNWGQPRIWMGQVAREFLPYGSIYHKLPFAINSPGVIDAMQASSLQVEVTLYHSSSTNLEVVIFVSDGTTQHSGKYETLQEKGWSQIGGILQEVRLKSPDKPTDKIVRYGQRALEIIEVQFLDEQGKEALQFEVGSVMRVKIMFRLNDAEFCESPVIMVAFQKDGIIRTHRFWTDQIRITAKETKEGTLEIVADPLLLGAGTYSVNVLVFKEGHLAPGIYTPFFTANPRLHDMHSRAYEVVVKESRRFPLCNDVVFQHPAAWFLNGIESVKVCHQRETYC